MIGGTTFKFGAFLNAVINFLIIAFVVFLIVKAVNKVMPKKVEEEVADAGPEPEIELLSEIRDLLKDKK